MDDDGMIADTLARKAENEKRLSQQVFFMNAKGLQVLQYTQHQDPTKWGTPDEIVQLGDYFHTCAIAPKWRYQYPWAPARYQKESQMQPGPYKSTTHGPIPMSMKGRELMMTLRDAVARVVDVSVTLRHPATDTKFDCGHSLAHARGELAKYISELENKCIEIERQEIRQEIRERYRQLYTVALDLPAGAGKTQQQNLPKETDMTKIHKQEPVQATEAPPKTRSQLIREASAELCAAQSTLENMQAGLEKPDWVSVHANGDGLVADWVSQQLSANWAAWRGKAITATKARVRKAEKAVAALIGG